MLNVVAVNIADKFASPFGKTSNVGDLIGVILRISLILAGIFVMILFLIGGFSVISGAGSNNPDAAQKGRNAITGALTGFVIIFAAYWIIRIIEVITGSNFITQPTF